MPRRGVGEDIVSWQASGTQGLFPERRMVPEIRVRNRMNCKKCGNEYQKRWEENVRDRRRQRSYDLWAARTPCLPPLPCLRIFLLPNHARLKVRCRGGSKY